MRPLSKIIAALILACLGWVTLVIRRRVLGCYHCRYAASERRVDTLAGIGTAVRSVTGYHASPYTAITRLAVLGLLFTDSVCAQTSLQRQIRVLAAAAHGKVSVACSLPNSPINCDLDPHAHPPMQSVFKFPLALTALHLVEQGTLSLDRSVRFLASDRILPHAYSPLQDKYPEAEVNIPLRELLRLAVSLSDNVAADVVFRIVGGSTVVDNYVKSIGVSGFHLEDNERSLHRNVGLQYRNWFEPAGAVQLLRCISDKSPLTPEHTELVLEWMRDSTKAPSRIKGELPSGTIVMHKSGTSDTENGVTYATNDIGLITLPDGRRLALAVFLTDSTAGEAERDGVIARIAKAAYDESIQDKRSTQD